jgi:hypothetical protein
MLQASGKSTRSLKVAFVEKMLAKAGPEITNPQILGSFRYNNLQKFPTECQSENCKFKNFRD